MSNRLILAINTGSSSLKYGLYAEQNGEEQLLFGGSAQNGTIDLRDADDRVLRSEKRNFASQGDALDLATQWLAELSPEKPCAIGHRVVHGGPRLVAHQRITPALMNE